MHQSHRPHYCLASRRRRKDEGVKCSCAVYARCCWRNNRKIVDDSGNLLEQMVCPTRACSRLSFLDPYTSEFGKGWTEVLRCLARFTLPRVFVVHRGSVSSELIQHFPITCFPVNIQVNVKRFHLGNQPAHIVLLEGPRVSLCGEAVLISLPWL